MVDRRPAQRGPYVPARALVRLVGAVMHPTNPAYAIGRDDLIVGTLEGAAALSGVVSLAGCDNGLTPAMPTCEDPLALGPVDCTKIGDINKEVDTQKPGLRDSLSQAVQPFATLMGVDSIQVYFHTFDAKLDKTNEFNAQPQVFSGNVSLHIWVEDINSIPPPEELVIVARHEGAHALDHMFAIKSVQGTDKIGYSISPQVPSSMYEVTTSSGVLTRNMKQSVLHVLKEGEYVDDSSCPPTWCNIEKEAGHPGDDNLEAFASALNIMLSYPEEFIKRINDLADQDNQTGKVVAKYCLDVLGLVAKYGDAPGIDAIQTLQLDNAIIPALNSVISAN